MHASCNLNFGVVMTLGTGVPILHLIWNVRVNSSIDITDGRGTICNLDLCHFEICHFAFATLTHNQGMRCHQGRVLQLEAGNPSQQSTTSFSPILRILFLDLVFYVFFWAATRQKPYHEGREGKGEWSSLGDDST
jgi:hypothetical protein